MNYEYSSLQQGAECPFCATEVPAGASVCTGCGAVYVTKNRAAGMAFAFFVGGLIIGQNLPFGPMLLFALALGGVGAYSVNWSDSRNPFWLRKEP
ncbi:hypothetical protein [uncultured Pseudodesulfovibrio sp.]|uniref:hypothetical protein n=1 Tax=uncultured Pseudodesulfovibrio sp. TaxID=2035858 RepID=UPI0029C8EA6C|nr:hypothetical protein [uncultured Pseudodesulfovibrio sp.]